MPALTLVPTLPQSQLDPLLCEVRDVFRRYLVFTTDYHAPVLALWAAHTFVFERFFVTPYLAVVAPEKGTAKTSVLTMLGYLTCRPWLTGRVTAEAIYTKVEADRPTLLLDEADAMLDGTGRFSGAVLATINSGYKSNGSYSTKEGTFSTYCPKAFAAIGRLPDTVADRAIPIPMAKMLPSEAKLVRPFYEPDVQADAAPLGLRLAAMQEHTKALGQRPATELVGRQRELWTPLLAIADYAGGDWREIARQACGTLRRPPDEDSPGSLLLRDIATILFRHPGRERWAMSELVQAWKALENPSYQPTTHFDTRHLGRVLRPYGIHAHTVRLDGALKGEPHKGYGRSDFADAISRYASR
jgi:hypothetical protein